MMRDMKRKYYLPLAAFLAILGIALLAFPMVIRALPGRYAYYLPEPLQQLRRRDHPVTLPTAQATPVVTSPSPTAAPTTTPPVPTATSPAPTSTSPPSETPLPTETAVPTSTPTPTPLPAVLLEGLRHERQGWNNCGPTTLAMAMSYWGREDTQMDIAPICKPDPEDKHVGIHQMERYAQEQGLATVIRVGGTLNDLKVLLNAGYPVVIESWYVRDARDQLGHYRLVIGYDDEQARFSLYDSLYDPPTYLTYQELDEFWRVFNRTYLVLYEPDRWGELSILLGLSEPPPLMEAPEIVGPELSDPAMYQEALATAYREIENPPESCAAYASCSDWVTFAWFNVGTNLTALGQYAEAASAYDQARQLGLHYRMLWYQFGPYEGYYGAGRYDDVIALADATLATAKNLEESYYWRGLARLALGEPDAARADFETALKYHEGWPPAVEALAAMDANP
jgi:tetratricopeptide (TPR) repeat protein